MPLPFNLGGSHWGDAMEFDTGFQQYSTVYFTQLYPKMQGRVDILRLLKSLKR